MKVKKFDNMWTMGLILFGAILAVLYLAKLIFPQWVIGVAEIDSIVKFGEYVDSHWWAYYLFYGLSSYVIGYFYLCACCRIKFLSNRENIILTAEIVLYYIIERFLPNFTFSANILLMLIMPTICIFLNKYNDIKYLYSTVTVFVIHSLAQILSLSIRDIQSMINTSNGATFTILLIDVNIWLVLLYNYYNFKENKNGKG
jgi:hypothetical protein